MDRRLCEHTDVPACESRVRLKELEQENARLRRALVELTLDNQSLRETLDQVSGRDPWGPRS